MIPQHWIAHRRPGDGELVGYLVEDAEQDDAYRPVNVFGHPLAPAGDIVEAMELLEEAGMRGLADYWWLVGVDGGRTRVKIYEATPDHVTVVVDDFNTGGDLGTRTVLPVPPGERLIPAAPPRSFGP